MSRIGCDNINFAETVMVKHHVDLSRQNVRFTSHKPSLIHHVIRRLSIVWFSQANRISTVIFKNATCNENQRNLQPSMDRLPTYHPHGGKSCLSPQTPKSGSEKELFNSFNIIHFPLVIKPTLNVFNLNIKQSIKLINRLIQ